jgi:hypothetical protein
VHVLVVQSKGIAKPSLNSLNSPSLRAHVRASDEGMALISGAERVLFITSQALRP